MSYATSSGLASVLALGFAVACTGSITDGSSGPQGSGDASGSTNGGAQSNGGASGSGNATSASGNTSAGNASAGSVGTAQPSLLAARLRRLTRAEYDTSVAALLKTSQQLGKKFVADVRQGGYTMNADQRVGSDLAPQLQTAAETLAAEAVTNNLTTLAPCASGSDETTCAKTFISSFVTLAFRRPLTDVEQTGLLAVYSGARDGGAYKDGIQAVIGAVLQSPSFLYITELGDAASATTTLGQYEIAASLSYLVTGAPPDATLRKAAVDGKLTDTATRLSEAKRLLASDGAKAQLRRFVSEWLGVDVLSSTGKQETVYPNYVALLPSMQAEVDQFATQVTSSETDTLKSLLTADYSMAPSDLAQFYGISGSKRSAGGFMLSGTERAGILTTAAFMAVNGAQDSSHPVKRGANIRRRLFCQDIPRPSADVQQMIVFPAPSATLTTRQRYEAHLKNSVCAGCHTAMDPVGFAFEQFDGIGGFRTQENSVMVDPSGDLKGTDVDGHFDDAQGLIQKMASSSMVRDCYVRQVARFSTAETDDGVEASVRKVWDGLPDAQRLRLTDFMAAFVSDEFFVKRGVVK
ncbi:MAG: DUF1592 domain-containing protein [Polyangiaceae bacterium]